MSLFTVPNGNFRAGSLQENMAGCTRRKETGYAVICAYVFFHVVIFR